MLRIQKTDRMTTKWQPNADHWAGMEKIDYPHFDAWQSDNPTDTGWCLNIQLNAEQEPIEVRGLHSPEAVNECVKGVLRTSDSLPVMSADGTKIGVPNETEPLTFHLYIKFIKDNIRLHRQKWTTLWHTLLSRITQSPEQDSAIETAPNQREKTLNLHI